MKIDSFITTVDSERAETIKGGTTPSVVYSAAQIMDWLLGDGGQGGEDNGEGGQASDIVVMVPDGEACQLEEVVIQG